MKEIISDDAIRMANSAKGKDYRKMQEELRGRRLENKRVVERRRANAKKVLLLNTIGSLAIISVVSMGIAYAQAREKLIKQRGGTVSEVHGGFVTENLPEEEIAPTVKEVISFMFDEVKDNLGIGR